LGELAGGLSLPHNGLIQNKNGVVISHNAVLPDTLLLELFGVADGTRTHDNRNHNPGLYQLSYSHR
jgi:hypothetical protein